MPVALNKIELFENLLELSANADKQELSSEQCLLLDIEEPNSSTGKKTIRIIL